MFLTPIFFKQEAQELINDVNVQAILGPVSSMQANFIIELGKKFQIPIISFTATDPSLTSLSSPYFFQIAQNDSYQVQAIRAIVKSFGWRKVVPIYVANNFGDGFIPYLTDALQEEDAHIPYRCVIPFSASDDLIVSELYKLMTMQTKVFVLHMLRDLASRVFMKAEEIGMMSKGYVWIVTDAITNILSYLGPSVLESMQGVLGVKTYVQRSVELDDFTVRWKKKFQEENPDVNNPELSIFGLWAYDSVWALAMAVENVWNSGNLSDRNGREICGAFSETRFKGLSGDFSLVNGQLQSPVLEIVNVHGNGGVGVGFWTPETGLTKVLNPTGSKSEMSSNSKANLSTIIWPGDSTSVPKGWEIPTNGKKLRIGVPVKHGFNEFIKVISDPETNSTHVTGFCADIFYAVLEELPYALPHEFIRFEIETNGETTATYNDLLYQVYLGSFDAVVGDTTIVANRSLYVDFTLPYTESGVSMVVPLKDNSRKNAWVFLKPLSWDLWLASGFIFVVISFLVWFLEHRINRDFRGSPSRQIGTSLWFGFSIMVFTQKEAVLNNLARFVVVLWFFVVLVLTQSYTASLASLLTVQQLQPTITDIDQILKNGDCVGYKSGSFVFHILTNLKFEESKLLEYSTPEEMDELFSKGTANGGIAAAFDEIPYLKLSLAKYCPKYSMQPPQFKTDGFGFAFPIGSPLVADISRAILTVTEGEKMTQIEKKWFGERNGCPSSQTDITSTSLSLDSFRGLFLLVGFASVLVLLISIIMFVNKERNELMQIVSSNQTTIFQKVKKVFSVFDREDHGSDHTRTSDLDEKMAMLVFMKLMLSHLKAGQGQNFPPRPSLNHGGQSRTDSEIIQAVELTEQDGRETLPTDETENRTIMDSSNR